MTDLARHPDAVAFVRAICSAPEDDTPRLVYADWLEEHGQADRAEFVRLQIRIAGIEAHCWCGACVRKRGRLGQHHNGPCGVDKERDELPDGSSRQAFLRRRERELFPSASSLGLPDGSVVTSGITPDGPTTAATIRRGFVAALTCTAEEWIRVADDVYWHKDQTVPCPEREELHPCEWCQDTGRMNDPEVDPEEEPFATTDCTHCRAYSRYCGGCTSKGCPGCGGRAPHKENCDTCAGSGRVPRPFPAGAGRTVVCPRCAGITITDGPAHAPRVLPCQRCRCEDCGGGGTVVLFRGPGATNPYHADCRKCSGTGRVTAPAALPHPIEEVWLTTVPDVITHGHGVVRVEGDGRRRWEFTDGRWKWIRFTPAWTTPA